MNVEYENDEHGQDGVWETLEQAFTGRNMAVLEAGRMLPEYPGRMYNMLRSVYTILTLNFYMLLYRVYRDIVSCIECESPHLPNSTGVQWGQPRETLEARFSIGTLDSGGSSGRAALAFGTTLLNSP